MMVVEQTSNESRFTPKVEAWNDGTLLPRQSQDREENQGRAKRDPKIPVYIYICIRIYTPTYLTYSDIITVLFML